MKNQKHTIIGACDFSIETLKMLKKDLMQVDAPDQDINWAIGGLVITLTSYLIQTCYNVFKEAAEDGKPNIRSEILEIQARFDAFVQDMVNHE